ncbi:hypothetical protein LCGC14_1019760 [marine sediment metagenome]|uniref:Uncharacterized protein n=1 Tax=marine sediment metagenome TaxID=412755 RepID=A0A0F9MXR0_9ZZZZ
MKIGDAKICLSIQLEFKLRLGKDYEAKALQLGLEALKRLEEHRTEQMDVTERLLPSESK